jgi:3D (Asp-Asp-Asp) domain-containing protein
MRVATAAPAWRVPRLIGLVLALGFPAEELRAGGKHPQPTTLTVTATAYSSSPKQTDHTPFHGAWGDRLDGLPDGQRAIAVSRDLVAKGLDRGKKVKIAGQHETFVVLDRTPARWTNRIDVYMGTDTAAARQWGRKKVKISWDGKTASLDAPSQKTDVAIDKPQRD